MNQIFINGVDYSSDVIDGLEDLDIELGLNTETKTVGKTLSSDITVQGAAYDYLSNFFFANCDSWEKSLPAVFKTSICGGITIDCEITSEGVNRVLGKKELSFNLKSSDEISRSYARLDSELITSNGFIETNDIPIMYYVDQPSYLQWALLLITSPIRVVINAIDAVLKVICSVVDAIPGVDLDCEDILSGPIFSAFDTWITGAGRWAPAPLVREMLAYQCQQTGLNFVSSILNNSASSRYNLSLICLTGGENGDYKDTSRPEVSRVLKANEPLYTTVGLLNELSSVFGADFRIIGDVLYFERVDYFDEIRTRKIFNLKDVCPREDIRQSYNTGDAYAYGEYRYTQDAFDQEGNSVLNIHYNSKEDFNIPYNPAQKGKISRQMNFGPTRFMFDKKAFDKRGFFNFIKLMDEFRDGSDTVLADTLFDNEGVIRKFDLVLSSSQLSAHKLIVLENNFNRKDAMSIKEPLAKKGTKQYWIFNKPMHVQELVIDFLYLDNPRLRKDKYRYSNIELNCNCTHIKDSLENFQTIFIESIEGKAYPESVNISFSENGVSMVFSDIRVICN